MSDLLVILLIVALVKFVLFGVILYVVFKPDIKGYVSPKPKTRSQPACMYCGSLYTHRVDEGQTRWEEDSLVLVTEYECEHCKLPFWHVERVPIPTAKN